MKVLLPGHESKERVALMLELTNISSEAAIKAITGHLVTGMPEAQACAVYGLDKSNFNRSLKALNDKANVVERIKEIDFANHKQLLKVVG